MKRNAGFSLIEVMVAIAILGVILVSVGGLMTGNLQLRRTSNVSTEAVQLATSYMESIKRTWSVLDNYVATPANTLVLPALPEDPRLARYTLVADFRCLALNGSVIACSGERNPELREIRLTVQNQTGNQVARLISQVGRPFEPRGSQ